MLPCLDPKPSPPVFRKLAGWGNLWSKLFTVSFLGYEEKSRVPPGLGALLGSANLDYELSVARPKFWFDDVCAGFAEPMGLPFLAPNGLKTFFLLPNSPFLELEPPVSWEVLL